MVKEIFGVFASYTTIHGFNRIADSKYVAQKVIWVLAFFTSFGVCIFQIYRLAVQYSNFQVKTNVRMTHGVEGFPGLGICNLNPMKYSKVIQDPNLYQVIQAQLDITSTKFSDTDMSGVLSEPTFAYAQPYDHGQADHVNRARQIFRIRMSNLTFSEQQTKSSNFYDFVKRCNFQGDFCNGGNFTLFRHPHYGLCYKFNSAGKMSPRTGTQSGIELILEVEQKEYIPLIASSAGISVLIFDKNYKPELVLDDEIILPVGYEVNIGLRLVQRKRLPGPKKICDAQNKFPSAASCIRSCQENQIIVNCRCSVDRKHLNETHDEILLCSTDKELECAENIMKLNNSDANCLKCKPPCIEKSYDKTISMSSWTSLNSKVIMSNVGNLKGDVSKESLMLRVYFSSLSTQHIEEELAYTSESFVSDIGGQLGLWIGMSVLSIAEVLELLFLIFKMARNHGNKGNRQSVSPTQKDSL